MAVMRHVAVLLVALTLGGAASLAQPDLRTRTDGSDWPRFLGPTGDAKSTESGIRTDWTGGLPIVWQRRVGEGYSAPSVAAGRLFVFDRVDDRTRLTCLNSETGEELWRSEYPVDYEDLYGFSNGPRAVPVVDGERVYTFGVDGMLRSHQVMNGKLLWEVDTATAFDVVQNFFGAGSTPVIDGELLIAMVGGSPAGSPGVQSGRVRGNGSGIVAFDKRTGEVRYRTGNELASYASPIVAAVGERRLGLAFARGGLLGFEPKGGRVEFHFPWRSPKLESVNASNPVVVDDTVFITESYGPGGALLRLRPGGYEVVWQEERGRRKSLSSHWATPIHHEGTLYGCHGSGSGDAELRAVDYATGQVRWSEPGLGRVTLLYVDGHLLVLGEYGELHLVQATPEAYRRVGGFTPQERLGVAGQTGKTTERPLLRHPTWNAPVLSHGLLYVRGKDRLVCLELIPPRSD